MPKISNGLPYFTLDTDLSEDKRIKLLKAEFGIKGFGIWVELLRQIYADEGYFMEWDNDTKLLFASDVGVSGGVADEVVKGSVKRGLFNESVFNQFSVLTSKHIQEKYFDAIKRRTTDREVDARILVIPLESDLIKGNVNIKLLNVDETTQSRVEESKVEESRVDSGDSESPEDENPEPSLILAKRKKKYEPTDEDIEAIYQEYPRKVGRGDAIKKIEKALIHCRDELKLENPFDWLYQKTVEYANSDEGQGLTWKADQPHPATWFNQERYLDDPNEWKKKEQSNTRTNGKANSNQQNSNSRYSGHGK